jgi:hypothetical protein
MMGFLTGGLAFGLVLLSVAALVYARIREQRKLLDTFEKLKLSHESLANKTTTLENMVAEFGRKRGDVPKRRGLMALGLDTHVQDLLKVLHADYCNLFIRGLAADWLVRDVVLFTSNIRVIEFADWAASALEYQHPIVRERHREREEMRWGVENDLWEAVAVR